MLNLLEDLNPADLISFTRLIPFPQENILTAPDQGILPSVAKPIVEYAVTNQRKYTNAVKFRSYNSETPVGKREGAMWTTRGILPPLGQKLPVNELETILLSLSHGADTQQLIDNLYDDITNSVAGIRARLEMAAGDLLTDGVFTLSNENGLTLQADFGLPVGNKITAANFWDQPTATPLSDELSWVHNLVINGYDRPVKAIASYRLLLALQKNSEYARQFYGQGYSSTSAYPILTPAQVNQVRAAWNLPPIVTYDTYVRYNGVNQRVLAEKQYVLVPPNAGETIFGVTAEALTFNGQNGNIRLAREDQPGIISIAKEEDDPVTVWTKTTANAMPVLENIESLVTAQVLAT